MKPQSTQPDVWASASAAGQPLAEGAVRQVLQDAFKRVDLAGKRLLIVIPDSTRTAPIPLMFEALNEILGGTAAAVDYMVALGTHQPMDDAGLSKLVGKPVLDGKAGTVNVFNHRWELPETFVTVGTISEAEVAQLSEGRLSLAVPVRINRLALEYDQLIVCGPVFPHEVVGFSGGNKYFFPGISSPEMINATHWLGALITLAEVIGTAETPIRRMINRAAEMIPTPKMLLAMVMHGQELAGLYAGPMQGAWRAAAALSEELDIVYVDKPFRRVLSIVPEMYDDLWTGAKGVYKMEPAVADGGEVVIYAPHITEVSYTHGDIIDRIGYHVRDYFVKQWERFKDEPWGILAHSTHVRGAGAYENGLETPRIAVTLATGIPRERCEKIGLGYMDPSTIDVGEWQNREHEGVKLVPRAGEILYRARSL